MILLFDNALGNKIDKKDAVSEEDLRMTLGLTIKS